MFLNRLSLSLVILPLIIAACTSRTVPTLGGVPTQPARSGITKESPPTETAPAATATQAPSSTPTLSAPPPTGSPTTTPPPFGENYLTATPEPASTQSVELIPSLKPVGTEILWLDWEGPGILYLKDGELVLSNLDGSQKILLAFDFGWPSDFSPETGRIVTLLADALGVIDLGQEPRSILPLNETIESAVISSDGRKIAYSLAHRFSDEDIQQLWTINSDGSENRLVIDDTGQYITDPGPFRLIPILWSLDNTKVYMVTTTYSEATPTGMYVADLASRTIEKALTPQITLWNVSFSPDRTRIAYRTFQWKPVPNSMPEVGPPFTLNVTDLTTGETRILLESETDQYFNPIWFADGNRLVYSARPDVVEGDIGLFTIDLATGGVSMLIPGSESGRLTPWDWLLEDRLVYTEADLSSGKYGSADRKFLRPLYLDPWNPKTLYTMNIDGTEKYTIDSEITIVFGAVDN